MIQKFTGVVTEIKKDKGYLNREIAEIRTLENVVMYFFVKDLYVTLGDNVTIEKEHDQMGYTNIIIHNGIIPRQRTDKKTN